MGESTENLAIEILRRLQGDMSDMRREMRDGLNRMDVRLGPIEQALASMVSVSASDRDEVRALKQRIERIERRLELRDAER
jgi:hypothetical protein